MKISIITVTYNSGKTLADTIKSVLLQTYTDFEYIIIDGASTDNTIDIIKQYEPSFNGKLKWISEPDKGLYDAMNKGINISTGDIIGTLNSDDFFTTNNILETINSEFTKNKQIDAIYGDVHFVNPGNLKKCIRYYSSKRFTRKLMILGFMPAHPSFYLKREYFSNNGLYKTTYKIAADFEFLLRCIYKNKIKANYIPVDMVTMRTGGASTSGIKSHKLIMKEHLRAFKENKIYTNRFLLSLRFLYKIFELILPLHETRK